MGRQSNPARKWHKSPSELVAVFEKAMESLPEAEQRKMFGYPCAFMSGHMFAGLHQENLFVRLPEDERIELLKEKGAAPFEPMPGRAMKEYVVVPESMLGNQAELKRWLAKAFTYVGTLPAKQKNARRATKGKQSQE